jgi:hypothetical protein
MDDYRMALRTGDTTVPRPSVLTDCTANYGNSDIYGYTSYAPAAPAPTGHR